MLLWHKISSGVAMKAVSGLNINEFIRGIKLSLPIVAGYIPLGFGCGLVCAEAGMSAFEIFLMSFLVYAGAGQYIAGGMIAAGASPLSIIITILIVNSRHILYTSVLYPFVANWSFLKQSLFAFQITDEAFAVHSSEMVKGASVSSSFAVNIVSHLSWIISNVIGGISISFITDTSKYGLDFTLYALFIALIIPRLITLSQAVSFTAGGITALLFAVNNMLYAGIVAGAVTGAFAGYYTNMRLTHGK